MSLRDRALLLVGHGSELSADASPPIRVLAQALRRTGAYGEVRTAFWKEEPYLHQAFVAVEREEVVVVPLFTSEGYFTERLVPRELGVTDGREPGGRLVRITPPVGAHPGIAPILLDRAREAAPLAPEEEREATLVLVGHGTPRHTRSGGTTYALAEALRRTGRYGSVVVAFLDQEPGIEDVLADTGGGARIVVPFFISEGWHAGITLPRDLGVANGSGRGDEGRIHYAKAIATHPLMDGIVRALAEEGARGFGSDPVAPSDGVRAAREARGAFLARLALAAAAVGERPGEELLEVAILPAMGEADRYELRNRRDRAAPPFALQSFAYAEAAEEIGARTAQGEPRPLRTAPNLRTGWRIPSLDAEAVWTALGHLYPGAALHRELARVGRLPVTSFQSAATRQTGIYAGIEALEPTRVRAVITGCCAPDRCLRTPIWDPAPEGTGEGTEGTIDRWMDEGVPCPAPCPVLLAAARRAMVPPPEGGDVPPGSREPLRGEG